MNPLSGVLAEAWTTYRTHARHLITIAFVLYLIAALLQLVLVALLGVVGAVLAAVVSLVAAFLLQAALVKAVEDVRDGRVDLSLGDTVQAARPYVGRVAIASILASVGIVIGLLALVLPGLYLLTIWCLLVPVIVLENAGVGAAFTRSRDLVRGVEVKVFGTLMLVLLILIAFGIVLTVVLSPFPRRAGDAINSVVSGALVSPFLAVVVTHGYYRLRAISRTG